MKSSTARGRPRRFDRDQALAGAVETFWRLGYDAASIRHLAAAMGISQPSLYLAYGGKAELFVEALALYERQHAVMDMTPLRSAATLRDGVTALFDALGRRCTRGERGCMLLNGKVADLADQRKLALHLRARRRVFQASLRAALMDRLDFQGSNDVARVLTTAMIGYGALAQDGLKSNALRSAVAPLVRALPST